MPEEVSKEALKACPFCGGESYLQHGDEMPNGQPFVFSWCGKCCARSRNSTSDADAIEAWNSRPSPSLDEVELENLALEYEPRVHDAFGIRAASRRGFKAGYRAAISAMHSNKSWNEAIEAAARKAEEYPSPLDDLPMALAVRGIANAIRSLVREGEG